MGRNGDQSSCWWLVDSRRASTAAFCERIIMMKPPRLRILILLLVFVGLIVGIKGLTGGLGIWTTGTLTCFFAAHLLAIPHNSGRYWTVFIALGLFAIAAARLAAHYELAGFHSSNSLPFVLAVGIPLLYIMTALLISGALGPFVGV